MLLTMVMFTLLQICNAGDKTACEQAILDIE